MSLSFRPVKEVWGTHSSQFVDHESLCFWLEVLAGMIKSDYDNNDYGDLTVIWIEKGREFLTFLESDPRFTKMIESTECRSLFENMRQLAPDWHNSVDKDESIRFYID